MRAPGGKCPSRHWTTRRLWLPRPLYAALPWMYCALGACALASGLFLPQPGWIIPYILLLAVACLHGGIWVLMLRRRHRYRLLRSARDRRSVEPASPA